jgi:hypothetical protein
MIIRAGRCGTFNNITERKRAEESGGASSHVWLRAKD